MTQLSIEYIAKLEAIAIVQYPIPDNMCAFRKKGMEYKRNAFVWKLKRELEWLTPEQIKMVINELSAKAGI